MERIDDFVNDLVNERGITEKDKEDLKVEFLDHILLLKQEYRDKGYDEDKAIDLAIESFGIANEIGNEVKKALPSKNKYEVFSKIEKIKMILFMIAGYFFTVFYIFVATESRSSNLMENGIILAIPIMIGGVYVNFKLAKKREKIKNFISGVVIFILLEKIILGIVFFVGANIQTGRIVEFETLINLKQILIYIVMGAIGVLAIYLIPEKLVTRIRNPYNTNVWTNLAGITSIVLMILYYLFPNRWYVLHLIVEKIVGSQIEIVSKNLLFIMTSNNLLIPNIGLIIFIGIMIYLVRKIEKKGIKSLF